MLDKSRWVFLSHAVFRLVIKGVNPLHPSIRMHILHTVLFTFLTVLTRRICLTIKRSFGW